MNNFTWLTQVVIVVLQVIMLGLLSLVLYSVESPEYSDAIMARLDTMVADQASLRSMADANSVMLRDVLQSIEVESQQETAQ